MGPGLKKARPAALVGEKRLCLVRLSDPITREWLDLADVVSEGRVEADGAVSRYFGSTSIMLLGTERGPSIGELARLVECDPHLRVRVVRLARREAIVRAMHPLGTISIELSFAKNDRGVAITVDVSADVAHERRGADAPARRHRVGP
jgi:hypothetical protein